MISFQAFNVDRYFTLRNDETGEADEEIPLLNTPGFHPSAPPSTGDSNEPSSSGGKRTSESPTPGCSASSEPHQEPFAENEDETSQPKAEAPKFFSKQHFKQMFRSKKSKSESPPQQNNQNTTTDDGFDPVDLN